jgi:hypothetical protein
VAKVSLDELLERNRSHEGSLRSDHFDDVQTDQTPALASVCCADSRVSQPARVRLAPDAYRVSLRTSKRTSPSGRSVSTMWNG